MRSKKQEELDRAEELKELKWVLSSKPGRRFLWRQLAKAGVFETTFSQHNGLMSFNEGKRSLGTELFADINEADVEAFFNMMRENREESDNAQRESQSESQPDSDASAE